jgi:beta-lactam-binding protein with PASTA domain
VKQIAVPDVVGKMSDKAVAALESAGLQAVEKTIYGPTDEDAGEPGVVYRQTPKAGTLVAPGSKVEVRYWYETQ